MLTTWRPMDSNSNRVRPHQNRGMKSTNIGEESIGTTKQETEQHGVDMLRLSSSSGLKIADEDDDNDDDDDDDYPCL